MITDSAQAAASVASSPFLEVAKTWVTYIGVLAVAIVTAYAGIRKALKDLKSGEVSGTTTDKVMAATLIETHTMLLWSESNRGVGDALRDLTDKIESLSHAINYNTETGRALCGDMKELRHQIERIRDKMP